MTYAEVKQAWFDILLDNAKTRGYEPLVQLTVKQEGEE